MVVEMTLDPKDVCGLLVWTFGRLVLVGDFSLRTEIKVPIDCDEPQGDYKRFQLKMLSTRVVYKKALITFTAEIPQKVKLQIRSLFRYCVA